MQPYEYLGITIDPSRTDTMEEFSKDLILGFYTNNKDETIQEALARPCVAWADDAEHAQILYDGCSQGHFMWSSPSFANAPLPGQKPVGQPAACYLPAVLDTVPGLLQAKLELSILSVLGGGLGQFYDVRYTSDKSPGPIPFICEADTSILAWKQGKTRRGALAAWMRADHASSLEFMNIRVPTGDMNRKAENIHQGFSIPDDMMEAIERGDEEYPLIDTHTKTVIQNVNPLSHFQSMLNVRGRTGEPFMYFVDTANRFLPEAQRRKGLKTHASNLCTEVTLAADSKRTPVCFLASMNAEKREDWDPRLVRAVIRALDNIVTHFVTTVDDIQYKYPEEDRELVRLALKKVKYAAEQERSIGLGLMGFHYALQKRGLSYKSAGAKLFNKELFSYIKEEALAETYQLGLERGVCPDAEGDDHSHSGRRNMHLLAIAPNANNADMLSTSAACEPLYANVFTKESRIGMFEWKNRYLNKLLTELVQNTEEVWDKIAEDEGSVKNLDFLSQEQKEVFMTAFEIDQLDIIRLAADRQEYICQSQSINLFFKPGSDINYVFTAHFMAWKWGMKSLYYYRTEPDVKVERLAKVISAERLKDGGNIVYGTENCPNCKVAKIMLDEMGLPYEYVDLKVAGKTAAEVTGDPSIRTVPQIFINGQWIGGVDKLREIRKDMMNVKMIAAAAAEADIEGCLSCEG